MTRPLPSLFDLTGRRVLVTGAGRGLGLAIARGLAEAGAAVWLNGRDAGRVAARAAELRAAGLSAEPAAFDVTDAGAVAAWAGASPPMDILVNNATLRDRRGTEALDLASLDRLIAVNATAAYGLVRALLPGLLASGHGAVVNVTSIAGPRAGPSDPGYTMAKGALEALTRAHAVEFGPRGLRVNAVAPGFFATEANDDWVADPRVGAMLAERSPLGRWARPQEVAGAVLFLASDAASYVNGHVLVVDGGMTVRM